MNDSVIRLKIQEPFFWSKQDEESFFAWLRSLRAVVDIEGQPDGLFVEIEPKDLDDDQLRDLIGLHQRYELEMKMLALLETPENQLWFRDSSKYWFKKVFT